MIQFLTGITMFFIGIKILKSTQPKIPPTPPVNTLTNLRLQQLQEEYRQTHKYWQETVHPSVPSNTDLYNQIELYRLSAEDAIKRETRAKAALQAVLVSIGSSQQQIDEVLSSIDSPEKD